jgi:zinc protease
MKREVDPARAAPVRGHVQRPAPGDPPPPRTPEAVRRTLSNGLRLVAVPQPRLPQIVLRVLLPAGSVTEPDLFAGTAALVGELLAEGTTHWSAEQLNQRLDRLGASVSTHVTHDFAEVEALLLSETLREGVDLLAEVVARPVFPPAEVERMRREALDALQSREDEPGNVADDRLAEAIFGEDHPYGRLPAGTESGVAAVSRAELAAFHEARYRPGGSSIVVAGDFDFEMLVDALEEAFGDWSGFARVSTRRPVPERPVAGGERLAVPRNDAPQAEIRIGTIGMARSSPDWIPAAVTNYILGGSTITGRFGANLREAKGWTYGARSAFAAGIQPAGWSADTAVDAGVAEDAVRELRAEIAALAEHGPRPDELRRAQEALVLSLPRAFETPARIVNRFTTLEAFRLPEDYWTRFAEAVRGVSAEEVVRIVERYIRLDELVEVVVG